MGKWVYRRPYFRQARNKLPLTRGHGLLIAAFTRRRVAVRRRTWVRRRTVAFMAALTHSGNAHVAGIRRALARVRRRPRILRRVGLAFTKTAATAGGLPIVLRRPRLRIRPRQVRPLRRAPGTVEPPTPPTNKTGAIIRFRRAVARNLEALRRRLRWRPKPEEVVPEIQITRVHATMKGRIFTPGLERGRIEGGA